MSRWELRRRSRQILPFFAKLNDETAGGRSEFHLRKQDDTARALLFEIPPKLLFVIAAFLDARTICMGFSIIHPVVLNILINRKEGDALFLYSQSNLLLRHRRLPFGIAQPVVGEIAFTAISKNGEKIVFGFRRNHDTEQSGFNEQNIERGFFHNTGILNRSDGDYHEENLNTMKPDYYVTAAAISDDGAWLVRASSSLSRHSWLAFTYQANPALPYSEIMSVPIVGIVRDILFNPAATVCIALVRNGRPQEDYFFICRMNPVGEFFTTHYSCKGRRIGKMACSPDGRYFAFDDRTKKAVKLYTVHGWNQEESKHYPDSELTAITFSPDGKYIALGFENRIVVWSIEARDVQYSYPFPNTCHHAIGFSNDSKNIITAFETDSHSFFIGNICLGDGRKNFKKYPLESSMSSCSISGDQIIVGYKNGVVECFKTLPLVYDAHDTMQVALTEETHTETTSLRP